MAPLKMIRGHVARLAPQLRPQADAHGHDERADYRRWYKTAAWAELRDVVFDRDRRTCQLCPPAMRRPLARPVADHKIPHRRDRELFFDPANVWTLCKPCHDGLKQRQEAAARARGGI